MSFNTGFLPVFEEKFKKLLKEIEKEYDKPKAERDKGKMKGWSQEAKKLRKLFRECKEQLGTQCCPHCGGELDQL